MTVEMWPIRAIIPYDMNGRKIPRSGVDKVAFSLREFCWRSHRCDGVIVVGLSGG